MSVVLRHFKLREQPFGVTPDPRYLYASATHREALSSLLYAIESGLGFVALTAQPGMGKTTLLFEALRKLGGKTRTVFLFQTINSPEDLMRALLIDLGVAKVPGNLVEMQTLLNEMLVAESASGKRLIVVLDEAQNLSDPVLEAVRMLSNFETARHKLMQIILCGQLQLAERLFTPQLQQLRQRISIFAHLRPFAVEDTSAFIEHRLRVAGYEADEPLFSAAAVTAVARHSQGIPRNINNLCFNALSLACALRKQTIDLATIEEVVSDLSLSGQFGIESHPVAIEALPFSHNQHPESPAIRSVEPQATAAVPAAPAITPDPPRPVAEPQPAVTLNQAETHPVPSLSPEPAVRIEDRPEPSPLPESDPAPLPSIVFETTPAVFETAPAFVWPLDVPEEIEERRAEPEGQAAAAVWIATPAAPAPESVAEVPTATERAPVYAMPASEPVPAQPLAGPSRAVRRLPRSTGLSGRSRSLSIAAAVLAALALYGWLTLQAYRAVSGQPVAARDTVVRAATTTPPAQTSLSGESVPMHTRSVRVHGTQTLYNVCVNALGTCPPQTMREVLRINGSIRDPHHLYAGQEILLPVHPTTATSEK